MRRRTFFAVMCSLFLALDLVLPGLTLAYADTQTESQTPTEESFTIPDGVEYEKDVVLVGVPRGQSAADVLQTLNQASLDAVDVTSVQAVTDDIVEVKLKKDASVQNAVAALEVSGLVKSVQPNYIYRIDEDVEVTVDELDDNQTDDETVEVEIQSDDEAESDAEAAIDEVVPADTNGTTLTTQNVPQTVNDPLASDQWALDSMNLSDAWISGLKGENGNPKVGVVVLDVGFDVNHPDLMGNIPAGSPYNACTGTSNVAPTDGSEDHGTHVAGIIAAQTNNAMGVAGVSYNAQVIPVCVSEDSHSASSADMAKGVRYAIAKKDDFNIRVINISMGSRCDTDSELDEEDHLLLDTIEDAYNLGIVTVSSAGNESTKGMPYRSFPAQFDHVVSVMNLSEGSDPRSVSLASSSNYNVDDSHMNCVSAPGTYIMSTMYGTDSNGEPRYGKLTGTSMASPQVAGMLALAFSRKGDLTAEQAIQVLCASTRDLGDAGWDRSYGWGEVDAMGLAASLSKGGVIEGPEVLKLGDTGAYQVTGGEATDTWSFYSTDTDVLTIDAATGAATANGEVSGVALVVATSGNKQVCKVVNVVGPLRSVYPGRTAVAVDYSMKLRVDSLATYAWEWSSDNTDVASVTAQGTLGVVVGNAVGIAHITATMTTNPNIKFTIPVEVIEQADIRYADITGPSAKLYTGSELKPKPERVSIGWRGGTKSLIEGKDYTLRYQDNVYPGTATIYLDGIGDFVGTAYIPFNIYGVADTAVQLSRTSLALSTGQTSLLVATVLPDGATYPSVTWSSSNSAVATVSTSGAVTGIAAGKATITARSHSGQTATCAVTVSAPTPASKPAPPQTPTPSQGSSATVSPTLHVTYRTHVQRKGWQRWVSDGAKSGTSGKALRLEAINIKLSNLPYSGGITYRTHIQKKGWQGWKKDGKLSGTQGKKLRLEAIQIKLTGQMAHHYDVYYRVHAQKFGWMGWARNGAKAGTAGYGRRLEAIQIVLVPKGQPAPGSTAKPFRHR